MHLRKNASDASVRVDGSSISLPRGGVSRPMAIRARLWLQLVVCFAIAALLASCGGPEVALSGTITDAYTGKPIPAATVTIGSSQLATDAGGKYQIAKWTDKDVLQVVANGYEPLSIPLAA